MRARRHTEGFEETTHPFLFGRRGRALNGFVRRKGRRFFRPIRRRFGKPFENEREPGENEEDDGVVHEKVES